MTRFAGPLSDIFSRHTSAFSVLLVARVRLYQVGVHVTPGGTFNGDKDRAEEATGNHDYFARELSKLEIAYLHPKLSDAQDERHGGKVVPIK